MEIKELPCSEKLAFDSQKEAEGAAVYAKHLHSAKFKTYKCKHCSLWHLASD
jgi:hypothetical protein